MEGPCFLPSVATGEPPIQISSDVPHLVFRRLALRTCYQSSQLNGFLSSILPYFLSLLFLCCICSLQVHLHTRFHPLPLRHTPKDGVTDGHTEGESEVSGSVFDAARQYNTVHINLESRSIESGRVGVLLLLLSFSFLLLLFFFSSAF